MDFFTSPYGVLLKLSLLLAHCGVIGFAVGTWMKLWKEVDPSWGNFYLRWFFAINIGLMVNTTLIFAFGMLGWLNRTAILWAGVAVAVAAISGLQASILRAIHAYKDEQGARTWPLQWLVIFGLFLVVSLKAFRAPGLWDDTMYQLPLARYYLEHQAIVLNEYLRFPLFPQNLNLLFALGLMLGGDLFAQAIATVPLFIVGIGLVGIGISLTGSLVPGVAASLLLLTLHPVSQTLGYAYVDNGLALFSWGATLALAQWVVATRRSSGWLAIAALLAGGAAGTKYFGAVLAALLGLYLLAVSRDWMASVRYTVIFIFFGSWWYVRSAYISGDPLHPVGGNIFGYFLWDAQDLALQKEEQATFGVERNPLNIFFSLSKAGVIWWSLAFATLVFHRDTPKPVRLLQFTFLAYFSFWFIATQVDRYLAPIYAVGCFLSVYFLYRIASLIPWPTTFLRRFSMERVTVECLLCLLVLAPAVALRYLEAEQRLANWQSDLEVREGFSLFSAANKLIPSQGPRLVHVGFERSVYFFDGVAVGDWFGPGRYREMMQPDACQPGKCELIAPELMRLHMQRFKSQMLAINRRRVSFNEIAYARQFDTVQTIGNGVLLVAKK